jgi:hypothetical protein
VRLQPLGHPSSRGNARVFLHKTRAMRHGFALSARQLRALFPKHAAMRAFAVRPPIVR